jgi:formate hydrogenlyase subunit 6/NADH:ubiquinone oxidoreductase subunit I
MSWIDKEIVELIISRNYYRGKIFLVTMFNSVVSVFHFLGKSITVKQNIKSVIIEKEMIKGLPLLDNLQEDKCDGCMECVEICPTDCLKIIKLDEVYTLEIIDNRCLYCNYCAEVCHLSLISLIKDYPQESS